MGGGTSRTNASDLIDVQRRVSLKYYDAPDVKHSRPVKGHRICCSLILPTCSPNQVRGGGGEHFFLPIMLLRLLLTAQTISNRVRSPVWLPPCSQHTPRLTKPLRTLEISTREGCTVASLLPLVLLPPCIIVMTQTSASTTTIGYAHCLFFMTKLGWDTLRSPCRAVQRRQQTKTTGGS